MFLLEYEWLGYVCMLCEFISLCGCVCVWLYETLKVLWFGVKLSWAEAKDMLKKTDIFSHLNMKFIGFWIGVLFYSDSNMIVILGQCCVEGKIWGFW